MGMGGRASSPEELEAIRAGEVPGKTLVSSRPAMTGEQLAAWEHLVACARQFVRCANEFPDDPGASAEYYDAMEEAQGRLSRAWEGEPVWVPWPTSPGLWWMKTPLMEQAEPTAVYPCGDGEFSVETLGSEERSYPYESHEGWQFTPMGYPPLPPKGGA